ncbi:MAG: hypothetical protein K2X03_02340 [Bryobacteraceae bacterium]|nr:hypothetical protein [Bryobacteraceae bacterium]
MTVRSFFLATFLCGCAMAQSNKPAAALACNMKAISSGERVRYNAILKKINASVRDQAELSDGYAWQLDEKGFACLR